MGNDLADRDWNRIWDLVPPPEERLERLLARMRAGQKSSADRGPGHRRAAGRGIDQAEGMSPSDPES